MKLFYALCLSGIILSSCVPHRKVTYFNDISGSQSGNIAVPEPPVVLLQPNDVVEINITSASKDANTYFQKAGSEVDKKYAGNTYQIARDSTIDIPLIGKMNIAGINADQASEKVRDALLAYLQKPSVNIRLISFKITILGEVQMPGVYDIPDGRVNVLEAIGMAGDLTIYGQRGNILLIRTATEGKTYTRLNLNTTDFLNTNAFYLQNGDVIYVEPSKGMTSKDDNAYRILPLALSTLTFLVVLIGLTAK